MELKIRTESKMKLRFLPPVASFDSVQLYDPIHRRSGMSVDVLFDPLVFLVRVEVQILDAYTCTIHHPDRIQPNNLYITLYGRDDV